MGETNFRSALKDIEWLNPDKGEAIIVGYTGSISHGTHVPSNDPNSIDDKDVMAVVIPTLEHYFALEQWGSRGTKILKRDEWDCVGYELRKMVSLLAKGNPNVLCMLWLDDTDYIHRSLEGEWLISQRGLFATRQVYHSFIGYAHGQAHRMTHMAFEGYMGEKRKALVGKYGYDTKNASHLIRLLRMGIEFLTEGCLYVKRKDATQLLEIKQGEWPLEQVQKEADRLFALAEEAYIRSPLPAHPDYEKINHLLLTILWEHFIPDLPM